MDIGKRGRPDTVAFERVEARDASFVDMLNAYRRTGGLASEAEILDRTAACRSAARRVASTSGEIVCFEWGRRYWLPWFQFDPADMSVRPGPRRVLAELSLVFDGWETASWFARPNLWIGDAKPVDLIDDAPTGVLGAARPDRFVAAEMRIATPT